MTPTLGEFGALGWQRDFIVSGLRGEWRLGAIRGGLGSGKSLAVCTLAVMLCETRPGAAVVLGMDTHRRMERVHIPLLRALRPAARWAAVESCYYFANGSTLRLVHFDAPAGGMTAVEGINAAAVIVDEVSALRPDALDVASSRARVSVADLGGKMRQPLVVTCGIPVEPAWWVERTREAGGRVWLPRSADNAAHLAEGWIEAQRALLSEREFQALVENKPLPPVGQVLHAWDPQDYPAGCVVRGWRYRPEMRTFLASDLGMRFPAAILAAEDVDLGAWVLCDEWAPDSILTPDLAKLLAEHCAPRGLVNARKAAVRYPLDGHVTDPAGGARNAQTGQSDLDLLGLPWPTGLGLRPIVERDPAKREIRAGVTRVNLALERRRLLMAGELYDRGIRAPLARRTIARAVTGYRYPDSGGDQPIKDGVHDHACIAAGSLVAIPGGAVGIEWLAVGDLVMTRAGPRMVEAAAMTGACADVVEVCTEGGLRLTLTPDHPVYVEGGAMVPAGDLSASSVVLTMGGPARVVSVRPALPVQVFNLTVEGEHEFYAGGILVSNCDALRYLTRHLLWHEHPLDGRLLSPGETWSPVGYAATEAR